MNTEAIANLYKNNPAVQAVLDYTASLSRNTAVITLDRATSVLPFGRREVTRAMKLLARNGAGEFVVGRRGNISRLRWSTPPAVLHKVVTTPPPPANDMPAMPAIPKMTAAEALHMSDLFMQLSDYLEKVPQRA